jgi:hypothetical protein
MCKTTKILLTLCLCVLLAGCVVPNIEESPSDPTASSSSESTPSWEQVASVDATLVYSQLPEIVLAVESILVASPSHPTAYLLPAPIPAGERVRVIGADQNAAWLLVLYGDTLGWIPSFHSRTGVGTLKPAVVAETLSDTCARYLDATLAPEETWASSISGSAVIRSIIYRPQPERRPQDTPLAVEIEGAGQVSASKINHTPLGSSGEVLLFTFVIENLEKETRIGFRLTGFGHEPLIFQAAFFSTDCSDVIAEGSQPPSQIESASTPAPASTPIIVRSGPELPDLIIESFRTVPGSPVERSPYEETYIIRNKGKSRSAPTTVHIVWNDGGETEFEVPPLNAGESVELPQKVGSRDSIAATWHGKARVDFYNTVPEMNESNNDYEVWFTVSKAAASSGSQVPFTPGPLTLNYSENRKYCVDKGHYVVEFAVYANGGKPPYTYYRDIDKIGGPTRGGIPYSLKYGEGSAMVGTFFVVDSSGQRAEIKFFSHGMKC